MPEEEEGVLVRAGLPKHLLSLWARSLPGSASVGPAPALPPLADQPASLTGTYSCNSFGWQKKNPVGKRRGERPGRRCSRGCEHRGTHFSHLGRVRAVRDSGCGWKTSYRRVSSRVGGAGMRGESFASATPGERLWCCRRDAACQGNDPIRRAPGCRCGRAAFARCRWM